MNKYRNIVCLLGLILLLSMQGMSQELRIDFKRINSEKAKQKTNGDYLNYLEKEVQKLIYSYGKLSKEYLYLQGFYLDEYNRIYQPYTTLNPVSIKEYTEGRKELVELSGRVYGDTSWVYADAILLHGMNFTGVWSQSLSDSAFRSLINLTDKAIKIVTFTQAYGDEVRFSNLSMLYAQKGDVFLKVGIRDSAIKYYDAVLKVKKEHPLYDDFFPSFLGLYANVISNKDEQKGLDFLKEYEPLIKVKYKESKDKYYYFLKNLLNHYLSSNYIDKNVTSYLLVTDTLCKVIFGELSIEYINYILDYKLSAFKKMGWKSMVFQELANLNEEVFNVNEKLLSQNESVFMKYNLEWFYYYQSINEESKAIKWLSWVEKNDIDTNINRLSFSTKITVYRELANYYRFKDFDKCLSYQLKVLNLETKAKELWGDYVIHQYHEVSKLLLGTEDTAYLENAYKFGILALAEFSEAYGKESGYYKSAQFTMGRLQYINSKGKFGIKEMWPHVYSQLNSQTFIPPLNTSVFQSYGDILNEVSKPDSADFFYNQIYLRNNAAQIFRLLGGSQEIQLKSIQDIYTQNYFILTQHLRRYKTQGNRFASKELAEKLFKKNLIFQIQTYTNEAIENANSENDEVMLNRIKQDKNDYDSLLYSVSDNEQLIDSVYSGYDLDKNWLLQSYLVNHSKDSTKLQDLKREYTYNDIQQALKEDECFVDIVRFLKNDKELGFSPDPYYALIIINKTTPERVEYFFIEDGKRFESLVLAGDIDKVSSFLSLVITNLKRYNKIYINPDGVFNLLNFYSLKDENDDYLINSKTFVYVNTIEGVFQSTDKPKKNQVASFFGNPVFPSKNVSNNNNQRNIIFPVSAFESFRELPYSKIEIESGAEALEKKGWRTYRYTEGQCSEIALKHVTTSDILHIASHGYYISEFDTISISYAIKSNPYLRSGLILGIVKNNKRDLNDNVLTAYEVMNLNLKNTSLVVLSACESAKGELKPGQGVYGIQRAFKIAGAKNVLVSVKNVDDKATQILMQYFYENVAKGDTYTVSLRNAQLQMLKHPLFNDPKYWSGFILMGQ